MINRLPLCSLFTIFSVEYDVYPAHPLHAVASNSNTVDYEGDDAEDFSRYLAANVSQATRVTDLERYLADPHVQISPSKDDFDVLDWWRINHEQYPALSSMARDFLSMPASTVGSESVSFHDHIINFCEYMACTNIYELQAFSTGGHILDDYKSFLKPETVEALVCGQDWLRTSGCN